MLTAIMDEQRPELRCIFNDYDDNEIAYPERARGMWLGT